MTRSRILEFRSRIQGAGFFSDRDSLLGIRQHRHALRQVCAGRGRNHHRGEVRRCGRGEPADRRHAHGGAARAVGSARRTRQTCRRCRSWSSASACAPDRSIPTCFRTRSTSSARCAIPSAEIRRAGPGAHAGLDRDRQGSWARAIFRCGWRMARTIPARRASASASGGLRRRCAPRTPPGAGPAAAGRIQAVRAGVLSHRYCRLGHVVRTWRGSRAAGARAGGYGPSLQRAEHRADCGVAAAHGHAGRVPLQRPALCRRRSDAGLDRSLPDLPHLPRDSCG